MSARSIIALDVGERRIGVALASTIARLAAPLVTITNDAEAIQHINDLIAEHDAGVLVVGLPRGMQGQETAQTEATRIFAANLRRHINIPVYFIDEAVTSQLARAELQSRGAHVHRGDIDALAATYILEDYLREQGV